MAEFRSLRSMAYSDDELYDMAKARTGMPDLDDLPEYPSGLCFTVRECCFERLGIDGDVALGSTIQFAAFARATSVNQRTDGCRIEAEIDYLSLGDSDMAELEEMARPSICLDENDHERLELDPATDRGDMLHLIGMARVESVSDTEWGGKTLSLQIVEATVEDEDAEADNE